MVDTLCLPIGVIVHEANIHESVGVHSIIDEMIVRNGIDIG